MICEYEGFTHSFQYRFHTVERTAYPRYAWSEDPQPQKPVAYDVEWIIDGWERITFSDVEPDQIAHVGGLIQTYLDAYDRPDTNQACGKTVHGCGCY